ncbi:MAG: hypothetical protein J6P45_00665 [Lachnospiraceae bacterium]|nr:hypothetical protein [Lachnospiraceae bacterium]MBR1876444.1 hypothetical protein [Lachnospiraceae bacterium]
MIRYIQNELKQSLRRREAVFYLIGIIAACVLANLSIIAFRDMLYGTNDGTYAYNIIMFAGGFFWVPYYTMIFIADIVFGKTYPDPYLRNRANMGLRRYQMYFGKLITCYIVLLLYVAAAFVLFLGISFLFQMSAGEMEASVIRDFALDLVYAFPLFMTGITIANMFLFMFYDKRVAYAAYFGLVIVLERLIMIFGAEPFSIGGFKWIKDTLLITPQFTTLQFFATRNMPKILVTSIVYIAVSAVTGCICFLKKDTAKRRAGNRG